MITDPLRNRYMVGLGTGLIIGASLGKGGAAWILIAGGVFFALAGLVLMRFEEKSHGKTR